jgi:hypothetical protein
VTRLKDLAVKAASATVVITVAAGIAVTAIVSAVVAVASAVGAALASTATVTGAVGLGGLAVNFLFGGGSKSSKD